ncbi:MAG: P-loop NTPase [Chloroflexi bacterium]|nr:P-loop NTPase [Chloroflexota bacterium]
MQEQGVELIKMNIDQSCDYNCEDCSRYFECISPVKLQMYERGRMAVAAKKMARIKRKIVVLGGKGGVGKTTVAVNLSAALAQRGRSVCCVDSDFDSPSVPKMLGVKGQKITVGRDGIIPVESPFGVRVISTGLIIEDAEVITWYHDMRRGATEEFCAHVAYGELDYLIVDLPPGTGSDSINMMQYIPDLSGSLVVTIASEVSQATARRATILCRKANIPVLGVVENMSGFVCPGCGHDINVLQFGGGEKLAGEMDIPFLGRLPLEFVVSEGADQGAPFVIRAPDSPAAKAFQAIVDRLESTLDDAERQKRSAAFAAELSTKR